MSSFISAFPQGTKSVRLEKVKDLPYTGTTTDNSGPVVEGMYLIIGDYIYILASNGHIYRMNINDDSQTSTDIFGNTLSEYVTSTYGSYGIALGNACMHKYGNDVYLFMPNLGLEYNGTGSTTTVLVVLKLDLTNAVFTFARSSTGKKAGYHYNSTAYNAYTRTLKSPNGRFCIANAVGQYNSPVRMDVAYDFATNTIKADAANIAYVNNATYAEQVIIDKDLLLDSVSVPEGSFVLFTQDSNKYYIYNFAANTYTDLGTSNTAVIKPEFLDEPFISGRYQETNYQIYKIVTASSYVYRAASAPAWGGSTSWGAFYHRAPIKIREEGGKAIMFGIALFPNPYPGYNSVLSWTNPIEYLVVYERDFSGNQPIKLLAMSLLNMGNITFCYSRVVGERDGYPVILCYNAPSVDKLYGAKYGLYKIVYDG